MARGRKRQFEDNAARQRAYRERQAATKSTVPARPMGATIGFNFVTQPVDRTITGGDAVAPGLAWPGSAGEAPEVSRQRPAVGQEFRTGAICSHSDAVGLLVRVVAMLDGGRVMARVLQAGVTRLATGHEYPFRADLLAEVGQ